MNSQRIVFLVTTQMIILVSMMDILHMNDSLQHIQLIKVINEIANQYFKAGLNFLVINLVGQYEFETVSAAVGHVHRNSPVPVVTLNNLTCGADIQLYTEDCDAEGKDGRSAEEIEPSLWHYLRRADTVENSVAFITFTNDVTSHCFVNPRWEGFPLWNPRGLFLLVITTPVQRGPQEFVDLFEDCWDSYNILNLVVVYLQENASKGPAIPQRYSSDLHILSYNPFKERSFSRDLSKIWRTNHQYKLFLDKTVDLHGYNFEVMTDPYRLLLTIDTDTNGKLCFGGPDGNAFIAVLEKFNASVNSIKTADEGNFFEDDTISSKSLFINGVVVLPSTLRKSVYPHKSECYTLIVPKAGRLPSYMSIILPFGKYTWLANFSTLIIIGLCWKVANHYDILERKYGCHRNDIILEIVRLAVWGETQTNFKLFVQRFFITLCLLFNIVIGCLYQASLVSNLTIPKFYPDLDKFKEVLDSNLKIALPISSQKLSKISSTIELDDTLIKLVSKFEPVQNEEEALSMASAHKNVCALSDRLRSFRLTSKLQYYQKGYPLLHTISDCFITMLQSYSTTTSTNPFLLRLGAIISRLSEGGLMSKWRRDYVDESKRLSSKVTRSVETKPIALQHLQAPFIVLACGFSIGLAALMCEIIASVILPQISSYFSK